MPESNPKAERAQQDGKPRVGLVEPHVRHQIARVMEHGADKYGTRNWRVHPIYVRTYVDAIQRHLDAWAEGEDADPDSGQHHLAHIGANVVVVLDALAHDQLTDDRDFAEAKPAGHAANQPGGDKLGQALSALEGAMDELSENVMRDHAADAPGTRRPAWDDERLSAKDLPVTDDPAEQCHICRLPRSSHHLMRHRFSVQPSEIRDAPGTRRPAWDDERLRDALLAGGHRVQVL